MFLFQKKPQFPALKEESDESDSDSDSGKKNLPQHKLVSVMYSSRFILFHLYVS
jgi:hypothetical protein